jgi:uncharacterized iron-regulated membrane protein
MSFKKINAWLHLWLGLISGVIVVIVSITGCIYVFEEEIRSLYEPWRFVMPKEVAYKKPSELALASLPYLKGKKVTNITYAQKDEAATVSSYNRKKGEFTSIAINPYTAEVLKVKTINRHRGNKEFDFFSFVLNGHRALWLPYPIGRPIVGAGVLIFVFLLISGIIMWWPKNLKKSNFNKSFKVKYNGTVKRINYDLHNVLGFYAMIFLLMISLTGLVWSYQWFSKSAYFVTSLGKSLPERDRIKSDTTLTQKFEMASVDKIYAELSQKNNEGMYLSIPNKRSETITATLYLRAGTYYKTDNYAFDQVSLKPLKGTGPFTGKYEDKSVADKLRRMNYDIHIGAILGIPGKIIAFLVSLISATLPITGFIIWWGKKKKSKKKSKATPTEKLATSAKRTTAKVPPPMRKVAFSENNI